MALSSSSPLPNCFEMGLSLLLVPNYFVTHLSLFIVPDCSLLDLPLFLFPNWPGRDLPNCLISAVIVLCAWQVSVCWV